MEPVDTRPGPSGEVLLGINPRRAYALAPCHHLFHTKCLTQWMAVKVSYEFYRVKMYFELTMVGRRYVRCARGLYHRYNCS